MNNIQTIKVSLQSIEIPAINIYVHAISILVVIFLIKLIFGKHILYICSLIWISLVSLTKRKSHPDWTAHCRERRNWPQKQDALSLDLKGQYLKSLNFKVTVAGSPQYWRAGFA